MKCHYQGKEGKGQDLWKTEKKTQENDEDELKKRRRNLCTQVTQP